MNRFNLSLPRGRVGLIWGLSLGLLMAWAASTVAQWDDFPKPLRPGETPPTFRVGEKAEAYWRGKFYPGVVTKVDSASGWVNVEITADGKLQSAYVSPQAGFVRKVAGGATSAARTPSASRAASNKPTAAAPPPPKVYPVRTWSDDTGKFKIEARFVSKDDKGVQLKKTDGTTLTVPLAKLSKADQFFLESLLAEEKTKDASPAAATALVTPPADVDRQANWNARAVSVQAVSGWSLVPDPGPTLPPASDRVVAIPGLDPRLAMEANRAGMLGPRAHVERLLLDRGRGEAIVVMAGARAGAHRIRLARFSMESLAHLGDIEFDTDIEPCDVSLSGKLLAAVPANISTDRLEILRFGGKSVSPYRRWINKNPADSNQDVDQLLFVGDDKVLTISTSTRSATVWDIDKAQALWTIKFDSTTMPVLSPGEKQLAVMGSGGIGILDTASGNTLARIEGFNAHGGILAYSPDGRRLGCLTGGQLQVWDLTTGKLTHEMWFKHLLVQQLDFLKNNYVLINRQYVVDLDKRIFLWQYDLPAGASKPQTIQVAGGRLWAPFGGFGKPHAVGSVSLPDAAARDMAASLTVEKVTAFQPGAKACVKCEVPGASAEELKHVTKVLTDQLTEAGIVVVAEAPLVVLASLADSGTSTANYRIVGGQKEQASVVQQTGTISIKENGKVLWAQSLSTSAPGVVRRARNQSLQEAVDRQQKENAAKVFDWIALPTYLARHPEGGVYGKSKLNP